ncbi:MAG: site-specific DNA-methyltransferase, partial [Syntrophaceae bacterium]|nr:site-specific DNA-methyltransferase [Syntrophaceae bacterium]
IRCIYIDPPYNTGQATENYEDGLEHSTWLSLMRERFLLLRNLMTPDGVFFCQLNDDEMAYGKVLLDEIFGRPNFLNQVTVQMKLAAGASGGGEDKRLKKNVEYILIYVKDNTSETGFESFNDVYDEVDLFSLIDEMEEQEKSWKYTSILLNKGTFVEERTIFDAAGAPIKVQKYKNLNRTTVNALIKDSDKQKNREVIYTDYFEHIFSDTNAQSSIRARIIDEFESLGNDEMLIASYVPRTGRDKGNLVQHYYISPSIRRVIWLKDSAERRNGQLIKKEKLGTYWSGFPLNNLTKEGGVRFPHGKKPEALIRLVLELATNPGDWVLDSFAGSGTTGAVAHKMGRRWIMVELREHCHTHIIPRMKKVIDGTDQGGVSKALKWKGGGGFRYFRLAPSLLENDKRGNWVISKEYNAAMLAFAMAKHEGFVYNPDETFYWKQGKSTEKDYIFTTTNFITIEYLDSIHEEMQHDESLLICCKSFQKACEDRYSNITVRKIPNMLLGRCEFGKDDYSLNIASLPWQTDNDAQADIHAEIRSKGKKSKKPFQKDQQGLFDKEGE